MLRDWLLNFLLLCIAIIRSIIEAKHSKDFRALMGPRDRITEQVVEEWYVT
jgi:hypothetical protein